MSRSRITVIALIWVVLSAQRVVAADRATYVLQGSDNYRIADRHFRKTYNRRESVLPHAKNGGHDDPDDLSVLSQPLPYEIGVRQLRAIVALTSPFPFDFHVSRGAGTVSGYLAPAPNSSGSDVVGIAFAAKGPMRGPLPGAPGVTVSGELTLSGTAYYSKRDLRLVMIDDATVFDGHVDDATHAIPVHVSYERKIQALPAIAHVSERR